MGIKGTDPNTPAVRGPETDTTQRLNSKNNHKEGRISSHAIEQPRAGNA